MQRNNCYTQPCEGPLHAWQRVIEIEPDLRRELFIGIEIPQGIELFKPTQQGA